MVYYIKTKVAKIVFGRKGIIYIGTKGGKYLIQNKNGKK